MVGVLRRKCHQDSGLARAGRAAEQGLERAIGDASDLKAFEGLPRRAVELSGIRELANPRMRQTGSSGGIIRSLFTDSPFVVRSTLLAGEP